jgi:hypothetical protein
LLADLPSVEQHYPEHPINVLLGLNQVNMAAMVAPLFQQFSESLGFYGHGVAERCRVEIQRYGQIVV